jgi:outer membrane receptor for ferrienterochelin and colicin
LYWTPANWLSASIEYQYERFRNDEMVRIAAGFEDLETHKIPIGLRLNHKSGFKASIIATFIKQKGSFNDQSSDPENFENMSEKFWVIDTSVGYRLPNRIGLVEVGIRNLFDERFRFQETDDAIQTLQPERTVFGKLTLAF